MFSIIEKFIGLFKKEPPYVWCLVGNAIDEHAYGEEKEIRKGAKHFSSGTKLYCMPPKWGDGYEKITVIGLHRKSRKLTTVIMPSAQITNWRIKKIYNPKEVTLIHKAGGCTSSSEDYKRIQEMLVWLQKR